MSTTRSQKRRNDQQSTSENVSEGLISPLVEGNPCPLNQDDEVAGPSKPKSPRIENSLLESLRASLKEEIASEIKNLLVESQKELLKLLKPETRSNIRENSEEEVEEETRSFYTPTKSVRISSTQNDPIVCRNIILLSMHSVQKHHIHEREISCSQKLLPKFPTNDTFLVVQDDFLQSFVLVSRITFDVIVLPNPSTYYALCQSTTTNSLLKEVEVLQSTTTL